MEIFKTFLMLSSLLIGFNAFSQKVIEVKSKTGRIWMDRNLGASQVATSPTDEKAYGDLYQWGRGADGHQLRTSYLRIGYPGRNNNFILAKKYPHEWLSPKNNNAWKGLKGDNNPCPAGFRLPTIKEWQLEEQLMDGLDMKNAFESALKLTPAGTRSHIDGGINWVGFSGYYWSSSLDENIGSDETPMVFVFHTDNSGSRNNFRAVGNSVRCIKN